MAMSPRVLDAGGGVMDEYIEREVATNVVCNILWKMNDLSTSVMAKALNSIPAAERRMIDNG